MQYRIFYFNKTIFKKNVTHFWPIWVIYLLIEMAMLPLNIFLCTDMKRIDDYGIGESAVELKLNGFTNALDMAVNPMIVFGMALICAIAVFYYLYQTQSANMIHSLPVDRKELFITNYISGLLFLIVPQVVSFLVSIFVCLGRNITNLEYLLACFLINLGMGFFAYTFAVFIGMLTGQIFVIPIFFIIANLLFMGIKFIVGNLTMQRTYGMKTAFALGKSSIFSPLYYLIQNVQIAMEYPKAEQYEVVVRGGKAVAIYALIAIAFLIISYMCYQKKQLETVGEFISISWIKPVFRWGAAICLAGLSAVVLNEIFLNKLEISSGIPTIIGTVLIGIIIFFVAEMFLEKCFKVFTRKRNIECFGVLAVVVLILTAINVDVLNLERKVPAAKEVKKVYMEMDFVVIGETEAEIKEIEDIHRNILDSKMTIQEELENKKSEEESCVTFCYYLKNGKRINRSYWLPNNEQYKNQENSALSQVFEKENTYKNYMTYMFGKNYQDTVPMGASMDLTNTKIDSEETITIGSEWVPKLYEAIVEDVKAGNIKKKTYDVSTKENYTNNIYLDYYNPKGVQNVNNMEDTMNGYGGDNNSNMVCIEFSKDCENIIGVLEKAKILDKTHTLITLDEYYKREEISQNGY